MSKSPRTRLGLEQLQDRLVPSVTVTQVDLDGDGGADDLLIVGDLNPNNVSIKDNGTDTLTVSVDANGNGSLADAGDLNNVKFTYSGNLAIVARMGAGSDNFSYELTNQLAGRTRVLDVALGLGQDTANITAGNLLSSGGVGSRLDVSVVGGVGVDTINVTAGQVRASEVNLRLDYGFGADTGTVKFDRIDDGASVDVDADLGDGNNTFTADFQEIGFGDHGDVSLDILGGVNVDTVYVDLHDDVGNGVRRSTLLVDANLGAGNDKFIADLDYGGSTFRVDDNSLASIHARGGLGDDTLVVQGVGDMGTIRIDPNALLDIDLKGGLGNDKMSVDLGKTDGLELVGGIKVRMDGGDGNDLLTLFLTNNATSNGNYDVTVTAGAGDDTVSFNLDKGSGTPTFVPHAPVLDGGSGFDKLFDASKPISAESFFESIV